MRNRIVQELSKTLTVSYTLDAQTVKKILARARDAERKRLLSLPEGPTDAEIEEAVNRAATEKTITEVNTELRKSAKHLRDDIDVIGEDYAHQYTRDFLEKRSWLNRKQLIAQRRLNEEAEELEEAEVEAEFEVDKALYYTAMIPEQPTEVTPVNRVSRRTLKRPQFFESAEKWLNKSKFYNGK